MKGFEELTKAYIYLSVVLVIIVFAMPALYQTIDIAAKNSGKLRVKEIVVVSKVEEQRVENAQVNSTDLETRLQSLAKERVQLAKELREKGLKLGIVTDAPKLKAYMRLDATGLVDLFLSLLFEVNLIIAQI